MFDLEWSENQISALIEGSKPDEPYSTILTQEPDDCLQIQCHCPDEDTDVCKHCIALLYAYSDQFTIEDNSLGNAFDEAIAERIKKGRNEFVLNN